jgi:hypothetical protein
MLKEIRDQIDLIKNLNESLKNLNEDNSYGFFKTVSSIPDYDKVLFGKNNELPKKYEYWEGEIKWMTKEKYLEECSKLQNTSYSDQLRYVIDKKVQTIMEKMDEGVKFDIPYLNYVENEQEGRHRVVAADNLGQKYIPVLILSSEEYDDEDTSIELSDMVDRWDDLVIKDGIYYCEFILTDWKSEDNLLVSIASGYDYYFLDVLFYLYRNNITIENYLLKSLKTEDIYNSFQTMSTYVMKNNVRYYGDSEEQFSKEFLLYCFILKVLKQNENIFYDCILHEKSTYYLKIVPQEVSADFEYYDNCQSMLKDISKEKHYIKEYNLISTDDSSDLYTITDEDVDIMKKIFDMVNKKYV